MSTKPLKLFLGRPGLSPFVLQLLTQIKEASTGILISFPTGPLSCPRAIEPFSL
jgi:hypothetical protein